MKKLLIFVMVSIFFGGANAQDAAGKMIQAGLVFGAGLNFTSPESTLISKPAAGTDLMVGMNLDLHFSADNFALSTGIEFEFESFSHSFVKPIYLKYYDLEVLTSSSELIPEGSRMLLDKRDYQSIYAVLPLMIKFQTNYLGYLRYFGKFGVRNSFLLQSRADNIGISVDETYSGTSDLELSNMRIPGDLSFYKGSIGLAGGVEWNFSGGTCLVGELGYYYGFTNLHKGDAWTGDEDKNKSIYEISENGEEYVNLRARQRQLLLRVSLLF